MHLPLNGILIRPCGSAMKLPIEVDSMDGSFGHNE